MNAVMKRLSSKVNALTVRERFLVFAVAVSILGAATDYFFISPLMRQQKALVAQLDEKSTNLDALREKVSAEMLKRNLSRSAEIAEEMRRAKLTLEELESEMATLSAANADQVAVSALLNRVLKRSEKVALLRVVQANTDAAPTAAPMPAAARGAIDITLAGSYLDLVDYLAALERALPQARWGAVRLNADTGQAQLTVRILTGVAA